MFKLLRKEAPQTYNAKNPPLNRPSEYKPPGGLYLESALIYKTKQSQNGTVTLIFVFAKKLLRVPNNCSQKVS